MKEIPLVPFEYICPSHTKIKIDENIIINSFDDQFVSFGSCFASNVTILLNELGFKSYYNYESCFHYTTRSLNNLLKKWESNDFNPTYTDDDFYKLKDGSERYTSLYHHRKFDIDLKKLQSDVIRNDKSTIDALSQAKIIFITLGNATYVELNDGRNVSYAGGIDKKDYTIKYSSSNEIKQELLQIVSTLKKINPNFSLVVTISPQRYSWHITMDRHNKKYNDYMLELTPSEEKDSLVHSNLDKAKLRVAVNETLVELNNPKYFYFPSFDIVMDELRLYETFSNNVNDNLHINAPHTSNYVINQFLNHTTSEPIKKALQFYRDEIKYKGRLTRLLETYKFNIEFVEKRVQDLITDIMPVLKETNATHILNSIDSLLIKFKINQAPKVNTNDPVIDIKQSIKKLDDKLEDYPHYEVFIYGAGEIATELLSQSLTLNKITLGFIDKDPKKINTKYFGSKISNIENIKDKNNQIILIASVKYNEEIEQSLQSCFSKSVILNPFKL